MKRLTNIILLAVLTLVAYSCKEAPTQVSGFDYTQNSNNGGKIAQAGEYVFFTLMIKDQKDSILQEMKEGPNMPVLQVPVEAMPNQKPNPVADLISILGVGDDATIIMPTDSLTNLTADLKDQDFITYNMKITKVLSEVEFQADLEKRREEQMAAIEALKAEIPVVDALTQKDLATLLAGKSSDIKTTADGIKYIMHNPGTGKQAAKGDLIDVHYYGVTTDGKMFDNSYRAGKPFSFTVGRGEVIKGWDLGLPLLKEGGSATIYLPYDLAYGEAGSRSIPAKADLVFNVKLLEVK